MGLVGEAIALSEGEGKMNGRELGGLERRRPPCCVCAERERERKGKSGIDYPRKGRMFLGQGERERKNP